MALFDSGYNQDVQQNQYLNGDPNTDKNANTNWMSPTNENRTGPTNPSPTTGINGGGGMPNISQTQPNPPSQVSNGTMLGSIAAGNTGTYMPGGYDQNKFNDPNKHDPKYDVGRILSKYAPGPQGLQSAMGELQGMGFQLVGNDKIFRPDVGTIDVGQGFGDPNGQHNWYWSGDISGGNAPQQSMLGMTQSQQNPFMQNNLMNQIYQAMQANRNRVNPAGMFNPTGGSVNMPVVQGNQPMPGGVMNQPSTPFVNNPGSMSNWLPSMLGINPQQLQQANATSWYNPSQMIVG